MSTTTSFAPLVTKRLMVPYRRSGTVASATSSSQGRRGFHCPSENARALGLRSVYQHSRPRRSTSSLRGSSINIWRSPSRMPSFPAPHSTASGARAEEAARSSFSRMMPTFPRFSMCAAAPSSQYFGTRLAARFLWGTWPSAATVPRSLLSAGTWRSCSTSRMGPSQFRTLRKHSPAWSCRLRGWKRRP